LQQEDEYSLEDSIDARSMRSRKGGREEPINLVTESMPNFAQIDHFEGDPFQQEKAFDLQDSVLPSA